MIISKETYSFKFGWFPLQGYLFGLWYKGSSMCYFFKKNPLCKSHFDLRIWVFAMHAGFPSPTEGCETL